MCLYPSLIRNKKYTPNQKNGGIVDYSKFITGEKDRRVLTVPVGCGECMECRKQKAQEWVETESEIYEKIGKGGLTIQEVSRMIYVIVEDIKKQQEFLNKEI